MLFMPSTLPTGSSVKVIGAPPATSSKPPRGAVLVFDSDGKATGLLNAEEFTGFRTALGSILMYQHRKHTERIVIYGAGMQALWHVRQALVLRGGASKSTPEERIRHITIVNESSLMVQGHGVARPSDEISLSSVLYTPSMPFNLLSVGCITRDSNCSVTFYPDYYVLQDLSTRKTISKGSVNGGIYQLDSASIPAALVKETDVLDVHYRLGHPSLFMLQPLFPRFRSVSTINCESCQLTKHSLSCKIDA